MPGNSDMKALLRSLSLQLKHLVQKQNHDHLSSEVHDNGDEPFLGALGRAEEEAIQEVQVRFSLI